VFHLKNIYFGTVFVKLHQNFTFLHHFTVISYKLYAALVDIRKEPD